MFPDIEYQSGENQFMFGKIVKLKTFECEFIFSVIINDKTCRESSET